MREKLFLSLQEYGTFMYVQNQFPLTFPSNTGKDKCAEANFSVSPSF